MPGALAVWQVQRQGARCEERRDSRREVREAGPSRAPRPCASAPTVRAARYCCKAGVLARHCKVAFIKQVLPRLTSPRLPPPPLDAPLPAVALLLLALLLPPATALLPAMPLGASPPLPPHEPAAASPAPPKRTP